MAGRVESVLGLLLAASCVAIATKWIRVPYTVALVLFGLAVHFIPFAPRIELTGSLVMLIFLPALLFEAAWNLDFANLKPIWQPMVVLATAGVGISVAVVGAFAHFSFGLTWPLAFLLGAILSATDPVSVVALFKNLRAGKSFATLIEAESLFNDGTGVVVFGILLAGVLAGTAVQPAAALGTFVWVSVGGLLVGTGAGFVASQITRAFDDHLLEIMLTTIVAYGSFVLGQHLAVSPVLAVVAAGIVMGTFARGRTISARSAEAIDAFWEYAAFVANSLLFLLVGLRIDPRPLVALWVPLAWVVAGLLVARGIVIFGFLPLLRSQRPPVRQWPTLFWGGLRGALSIALALSLPDQIADRTLLIALVFGCVLFTLVVQGLTMPLVLQVCHPSDPESPPQEVAAPAQNLRPPPI